MQPSFWYFYINWWTISKALRNFETYVLVISNLWGKLLSSIESPITFDESFKVTSVPFFVSDFKCELDNFTFKVLYWVVLYWCYIKTDYNYNTLTVPCEKYKIVSQSSSIMKNIAACPQSIFQ